MLAALPDRRLVRLLGRLRDAALRGLQRALDRLQLAADEGQARLGQRQPWAGADQLGGQGGKPTLQRQPLPAQDAGIELAFDQPGRPGGVAGSQGMADGLVGQALCLVPGGHGPVQLLHPLGPLLLEADAEQVGEQVVVAPPAPHLVQRVEEQVGPLGLLEQLLAVAPPRDRSAQRARQPLQDRRLQQEGPQRLGLAVQHLLGQVVQHVAVAAREPLHKGVDVGVAP
jgi:hypothetical protein